MNNLMAASRTSSLPRSKVVPVTRLSDAEREQMFLLLTDYFENVTRPRFERDLLEKESALLLRDDAGTIKGFSTIMRASFAQPEWTSCSTTCAVARTRRSSSI